MTDLQSKLAAARDLVSQMGSQLSAYGGLNHAAAEMAPPPRWEPAPPAALPAAVVAASAHAPAPAAAERTMQMPAALMGMPAYNGTIGQMSLNDIRGPKI